MRSFILIILVAFGLGSLELSTTRAENNASTGYPTNSQVSATGYNPDAQSASGAKPTYPFITATSSTSPVALTNANLQNLTTFPRFAVNGRPNIPISARFSVSGVTQSVAIRYVAMYVPSPGATPTLLGVSPVTTLSLEFAPATDNAGLYLAPDYLFDSLGATDATIQIVSVPASGTVTLGMGSY